MFYVVCLILTFMLHQYPGSETLAARSYSISVFSTAMATDIVPGGWETLSGDGVIRLCSNHNTVTHLGEIEIPDGNGVSNTQGAPLVMDYRRQSVMTNDTQPANDSPIPETGSTGDSLSEWQAVINKAFEATELAGIAVQEAEQFTDTASTKAEQFAATASTEAEQFAATARTEAQQFVATASTEADQFADTVLQEATSAHEAARELVNEILGGDMSQFITDITHRTLNDAQGDDNSSRDIIRILEGNGSEYRRAADQAGYNRFPDMAKFTDASGLLWVRYFPGNQLIFSSLVKDPQDRAAVDQAVQAVNALIKDGTTIVFDGEFIWPTVHFKIESKKAVTFKGGSFVRKDDTGSAYIIEIANSEGCIVDGVSVDSSAQMEEWFKNGVYVRGSINCKVINCYFKNCGGTAIHYARGTHSEENHKVLVDGIIISNNIFEHCQQISTNSLGAVNVLITNNIFKNGEVKITQRTTLEPNANTVISGNIWDNKPLPDGSGKKCISVQGANNVIIEDNSFVQRGKATVFEAYPNENPPFNLEDFAIATVDVTIRRNRIRMLEVDRVIEFWTTDQDGQSVNTVDCHYDISDNWIRLEVPFKGDPTDYKVNPVIYLSTAGLTEDNLVAGRLTITGNEVVGHTAPYLVSNANGYLTGSEWIISGNSGSFEYGLIGGIYRVRDGARLIIQDNNIKAASITSCTWITDGYREALLDISRNTVRVAELGDKDHWSPGVISNHELQISHQIFSDNTFIREGKETLRAVFWLFSPEDIPNATTHLVITNNTMHLKGEYKDDDVYRMRPLYCNGIVNSGVPFTYLTAANNVYQADNPAFSDNPELPVESLVFRNLQAQPTLYVVQRHEETKQYDSTCWQKYEIWSDGAYRQWGREKKVNEAPQSGQIFLGKAAANADYTVRLTAEAGTPTVVNLKSRTKDAFTTHSVELSDPATEVFPYLHYEVEYRNGDSEG